MNLAFAAVGRRVELVRAFRSAKERLGIPGRLIGLDIDPLAPGLRVVDSPYIVPPLYVSEFVPSLTRICQDEEIDVVFPLIDPMIEVLACHRAIIEETGARVAAVSTQSARLTNDKLLLVDFFESLGLSTPRTWSPAHLGSGRETYPLFIKPRRGSASQNAFKVENNEHLEFFLRYIDQPIVQEFLPGPEITTDVICDLNGEVLAVISRQRIEVRSGEVSKGVTVWNQEIIDGCSRIAKALPACGPITVQCILKDQEPYFTEINARLGGGVPLAIAAGCDVPGLLLARLAGIPITVPPLGSYKTGMHMTRFDDSFFLNPMDLESTEYQVTSERA